MTQSYPSLSMSSILTVDVNQVSVTAKMSHLYLVRVMIVEAIMIIVIVRAKFVSEMIVI